MLTGGAGNKERGNNNNDDDDDVLSQWRCSPALPALFTCERGSPG